MAWVIPQDIECFKYLEGYLLRHQIPFNRIGHEGWINNNLQEQIKTMERQEVSRSQMRPTPPPIVPPTVPFTTFGAGQPGTSPQKGPQSPQTSPQPNSPEQPQTPGFGIPAHPAAPLPTCTQGELGIEQDVKYNDDFDKDLAFLKSELHERKKDPVLSGFYEESTRRQPIKPEALADDEFLKALQEIKSSKFTPGEPIGYNPGYTPGATKGNLDLGVNNVATSEYLGPQSKLPVIDVSPLQGTKIYHSNIGPTANQPGHPGLPKEFPLMPGHPNPQASPNPQAPPSYNMSVGPSQPTPVPIQPQQPPIQKPATPSQPQTPPILKPTPSPNQDYPTQPQIPHLDNTSYLRLLRAVGI